MLRNNAITSVLRGAGLSAPITVTWEVTNRCNLRCVHCLSGSAPDADTSAELGLEEAKAVVDQLAAARVFQIHFGGGEPFVYPGFMELLRHALARGFCCLCISTNGALLNERRIAELEAIGGIYLQISLDGATEASCDAIRGAGAYRRAVAALERLRGSSIVRTVNFVLTRQNAHELDDMHALAGRCGAILRVTRLKPSGRGAEMYTSMRPTQGQLATLHRWLTGHPDVLTGDTFFHLNPFGGTALPGFQFCGAARMTCLITPNGDVFPCAFTQQEHFLAGNLRQENFQHIWEHGEVFNALFRKKEGDACSACPAFEGCGGGCPAVKHALTGRLDIPDPDCVLETARAGIDSAPLCHG
ncbi:MAG: mycofactocin radical SAM maturase [SAR324 cluster bacterium]|nr:mycofactocin radical SAM maturase [SAR324 cluster bacterium]